jgi:hypothetical protein
MKGDPIYVGRCDGDGNCVVSVLFEGEDASIGFDRHLPLRLDLANHSPTGFAWGYGGSGPAQLALAIIAYHFRNRAFFDEARHAKYSLARYAETGDALAVLLYQNFKWDVIAHFTQGAPFTLTTLSIREWCMRSTPRLDIYR